MKNKKILITGGSGFIGQNLIKRISFNSEIVILDKAPLPNYINNSQIIFHQKNLTNIKNIIHLFEGVDVVFHLAADISIKYCIEHPNESLYNNTLINNNVLECCRINNVKRVIFSSTAAVYKQKNTNSEYSEDDNIAPLNPYSASKAYGENLCKVYWNLYNVETIILRYFNVYGNLNVKSNYTAVLNNFLYSYKNSKPLYINGDGNQTRDFIHVEDVVNANILASTIKLKEYGEIFNIGTGHSVTINEIAQMMSNNIIYKPALNGELYYSCANIQKANNLLKWRPQKKLRSWIEYETGN